MRLTLAAGALCVLATVPAAALPTQADCDAAGDATVLQPAPDAPPMEARAVWLDGVLIRWPGVDAAGRFRLYHSARGRAVAETGAPVTGAEGVFDLESHAAALPPAAAGRFRHVAPGITLRVPATGAALREVHRGQLLLVHEDSSGRVLHATRVQSPGALDALYGSAADVELGVKVRPQGTRFALWAPTARHAALCLYRSGTAPADSLTPLERDAATGAWSAQLETDLSGRYYSYLVDVFVDGVGLVRNRVTDPYSVSLTADSRRSYVADLDSPTLVPPGWDKTRPPDRVRAPTDAVIYELHVRDFSASDATVPGDYRGKYLAFTVADSAGMRHLERLAAAGVTDVHLLPVFDFGSVPEQGCVTPAPAGPPDGESQQRAVAEVRARDCFNWGYDPLHFTAPEGSYATDPTDGAVRIIEFRRMVQALHRAGLRVGMDVVYNHTYAGGQDRGSVLDRIVPGYYHRLDEAGRIADSTCGGCANTATEHLMMAKLMIDSAATWTREYRIDSFRFDLMGHQPRAVMDELQARVDAAAGRHVLLIGEGWNFGEVADGRRFVQASQLSLNGSGIATFSDRARDAIRGRGASEALEAGAQGYVNGLHYDRNADAAADVDATDLMRAADLVRVGLAGSLRSYPLRAFDGRRLEQIPYGGQPAGYVTSPGEVVNYVENHDNPTLYDLNVLKLPLGTTTPERARVQLLALAFTAFSQGIAYYHAGGELLRSKSMDRNSYDSGDWFNRIDWTGRDNAFGSGLPPAWDNASGWPLMRPRLADPRLKPSPDDIRWTRDAFEDLLRIRSSSTLFRLRSAQEVAERLRFLNTGPEQVPTVIAAHLQGAGYPGAGFRELLYLVNVDLVAHTLRFAGEQDKGWDLHPVHRAPAAADRRPRESAGYDAATGNFRVPPRTAVVFVLD